MDRREGKTQRRNIGEETRPVPLTITRVGGTEYTKLEYQIDRNDEE